MRLRFTAMMILLLSTAASTALAQSAPAGAGPKTTSPSEIEKDSSAVLPSAGTSGSSAAPTMVRDCVKEPHHCTTPPSRGDRATAAGDQQPAATEPKKNKAP